jgi:hypothetical protein
MKLAAAEAQLVVPGRALAALGRLVVPGRTLATLGRLVVPGRTLAALDAGVVPERALAALGRLERCTCCTAVVEINSTVPVFGQILKYRRPQIGLSAYTTHGGVVRESTGLMTGVSYLFFLNRTSNDEAKEQDGMESAALRGCLEVFEVVESEQDKSAITFIKSACQQ